MIYTLSHGVRRYNSRLHYSLYGGVEYFPNYSLAWKELVPLAAVPAVAIALLVAIINFHVPSLTTPGKGKSTGASSTGNAVLSSLVKSSSSGNTTPQQTSTPAKTPSSSGIASTTTDNFLPVPTSTGTSTLPEPVVGGMGSGGGGTGGGITDPVPPPTGDPITVQATTPLVNADATVNTQQPQAGVDVFVPATGTGLSAGLAL